jgi:hypothetical protein
MKGRWTLVAVVVPVVGLAAFVGRAELAIRTGPVWTIPIEGHDPRDLLHGQYLEYRYRPKWAGLDTCGAAPPAPREFSPGCCVCLVRDGATGHDPFVQQVRCDAVPRKCEATLHAETMTAPQRYFVPEDRGRDLEGALRAHEAAIELTASPAGTPAVRELLLDGRPWRDVIGR